jgi:hypothetical protein
LASASLVLTAAEQQLLEDVSLPELIYPYWHQLNTAADRMGPADLALHTPHIKKRQPRM